MAEHPKTIQIFLPNGDAQGIRIADITSRTIQAIQIPKHKLSDAARRAEVCTIGVYFLFGENEGKKTLFIAESENCYDKLLQDAQKPESEAWDSAVVVTSKTASLTKAHYSYLKWVCLSVAEKSRAVVIKQSIPTEPFLSEPMKAELLDNFGPLRILLTTLGFPFFEMLSEHNVGVVQQGHSSRTANAEHFAQRKLFEERPRAMQEMEVFHCKRKDYYAEGEYSDEGFLVYKGSRANRTESKSANAWIRKQRLSLKEKGLLHEENGGLIFDEDVLFKSPSAAVSVIYGIQENGWTEWKNKDGLTLDELKRNN